ncbi:hypothetical protein MPDQ_007359 [Monascus purpureus]|uniref:Uncharacterized protein n=1 Tax=Monascus purpureus TaxID=5098 RepID=A0A507QSL2_MONPU|nr:hypothetical protein MPDQ_007359 [Monascus purpureus]
MLVSFRAMVIVTLRISSCQPPRLRTVVLTRDAFLTPTPSDTLEANGITVDRDTACKHHRLFTLDRSDSAMTSLDNRLYGHSMKALTWQLQNISECDRRGRTAYQDVPLRVCTVGRGGKWNGAERKVSNMRRSCDKGVRIDNDKLRSETGPGKTIT